MGSLNASEFIYAVIFVVLALSVNNVVLASCDPPCMSMDPAYNAVCAKNDTCILVFKCEDNNPCTDDVYDPMTRRCRNTFKCQGRDPCLIYGCLANGTCTEEPKYTNDSGCYNITCDPLTGEKIKIDLCVSDDWCVNRICEDDQCVDYETCNDFNLCTNDHCNNVTRTCSYTDKCDDGKNCTLNICNQMNGICSNPFKCPSDKPCWEYTCDEPDGICEEKNACDDGNECTRDDCWLGQCFYHDACIPDDPCKIGMCVNNTCVFIDKTDTGNPCEVCTCTAGILDCKSKCPKESCMAYSCDPMGSGECEPQPPCNNTDPCFRRWCENDCCLEEPVCVSYNPCVNVTCDMGNCNFMNLTGTPCNYGFGNCTNGMCVPFPGSENAGPGGQATSQQTMLIIWIIFGILLLLMLLIIIFIILYASRDRRERGLPQRSSSRIGKKMY